MKRTIKLAVAAAVALTSTAAFATNGDNLIGVGAKARGMGGVGIGMSHGAESGLANPAMIATVKGTEVSFGGTVFMPDVETNVGMGQGSVKSDAKLSVIPEVAIAQKVSDSFTWGIGMYGTAGMGTDYRHAAAGAGNFNMVTNLQLMQFAVPLAYSVDGLTVAISPVLQYGSLDINYYSPDALANGTNYSSTKGVAQDLGRGYNVGASYVAKDLTLGAVYKSAIDMTYDGQISRAMFDFGMTGSDHLEQPSEYGVGISYKLGDSTFAADYKKVKWSSAQGYKDFGWDDQNVYVLGYEYATSGWALRAGYNHAKSPIKELSGSANAQKINMFNLLGFPAIVENHYTLGGSYDVSKTTSLDLAYVYVPETTETFVTTAATGGSTTTKHSQDALSVQVNLKF